MRKMERLLQEKETPVSSSASESPKSASKFPALQTSAAAGIAFALLLCFFTRRACLRRKKACKIDNAEWPAATTEPRRYKLEDVEKATKSFSEERLIGSGAFGNVYRGVIHGDRRTLAIKRAHSDSHETVEEFRNEVELLSRIKHKNLVSLVGYCAEAGQRVLLYEYVSNGSLADYITPGPGKTPLTWQQRLNIAVGSAKGIAHLHGDVSKPSIIHRDIKPSNIMLDHGFEAKISDFGLVRMGPSGDESHVSTQVKGTPGYMDPAYCSTLHLSTSADVYSFGVILLQLVTSSAAVDHTRHGTKSHISDWARASIESGRVEEIVDPGLEFEARGMKTLLRMAQLGIRCTAWNPKERPTMAEAAKELEEERRRATRSARRSSGDFPLESISIEGVGLQRFSVGSCGDMSSIKSSSLRCLEVNESDGGGDGNNLTAVREDMNMRG
ncbi:putative LRR receptor-like serine/threonine-protein kinase [Platanthera guangdongensis]|uniref:LRR receptor-like serine/threonine-protein kinase n=1 Tax=Platanthera guangdongensis TaxID=2320717 RepID=A0ABR2LP42_9ASPA